MEESIGNDSDPTELNIDKILTNSFLKLDADISMEAVSPLGVKTGAVAHGTTPDKELMDVAKAGSCACVAFLNGKHLYVANSGDARAYIGQGEEEHGVYVPFAMSNEHNSENINEVLLKKKDF
jgi:pyruvate dehydrogenase phosphatase